MLGREPALRSAGRMSSLWREARRMSPLRQRMIEEMRMRDFSQHTIAAYVSAVYRLSKHYGRSPDRLDREQIRAFLLDLVQEKRVSWSYYKQVLAALRYFYRHVLRRGEVVEDVIGPRAQTRLPSCLARRRWPGSSRRFPRSSTARF